jgi:two-component system sensor histidine kinase CiaH
MKFGRNIFHSTSLRLTAMYLLVIMLLSFAFSVNSYRQYAQDIDQTLRRPLPQIARLLNESDLKDVLEDRVEFADDAKNRYLSGLITLNVFIFLIGGSLSYYLARRSLKPIEKAHEAQSRFVSDASHELRTPIAAMRLENELTLTDKNLTLKEARKQLESNLEELDKLTALSENLLKLSRLENDSLQFKKVRLEDVMSQTIERLQSTIHAKQQKLSVDSFKNINIHGDLATLTEAFVTVVDNASKYSPEKSTIKIKKRKRDDRVEIDIIDKGIGIEEHDLERVFDRFYRADQSRTKNSQNGYGIGLSIAKATIEAHDGSIDVKSTPKKGSTFTISLPLV